MATDPLTQDYFKAAEDWFFDRFAVAQVQANRWFVACIVSTLLCIALTIGIISLLPLKKTEMMLVRHNSLTGENFVEKVRTPYVPVNEAEVQADIVRYITSYMSYTAVDINQRYHLVMLLSSPLVQKQYAAEQANDNPLAPVNVLSEAGTRTVKIEDIIFLDQEGTHEPRAVSRPAKNLAKVDLITITSDRAGHTKTDHWVATIAWVYQHPPTAQEDVWLNWKGFTVTAYRIDQKNV